MGAAMFDMAQPQAFLGGGIEFVQQLAFPAIPHAGAHRADIDDGQQA